MEKHDAEGGREAPIWRLPIVRQSTRNSGCSECQSKGAQSHSIIGQIAMSRNTISVSSTHMDGSVR